MFLSSFKPSSCRDGVSYPSPDHWDNKHTEVVEQKEKLHSGLAYSTLCIVTMGMDLPDTLMTLSHSLVIVVNVTHTNQQSS